jgi:hypothetical protein
MYRIKLMPRRYGYVNGKPLTMAITYITSRQYPI